MSKEKEEATKTYIKAYDYINEKYVEPVNLLIRRQFEEFKTTQEYSFYLNKVSKDDLEEVYQDCLNDNINTRV